VPLRTKSLGAQGRGNIVFSDHASFHPILTFGCTCIVSVSFAASLYFYVQRLPRASFAGLLILSCSLCTWEAWLGWRLDLGAEFRACAEVQFWHKKRRAVHQPMETYEGNVAMIACMRFDLLTLLIGVLLQLLSYHESVEPNAQETMPARPLCTTIAGLIFLVRPPSHLKRIAPC
jgi:hypothetical protein